MRLTAALVSLGLITFLDMSLKLGHCSPPTSPICPYLGPLACKTPEEPCDCDRQCCSLECGFMDTTNRISCFPPGLPIG
ncbi:unnamed protein product [Allacma fusca]|uniref:WAP domain-containing protein n=1 Tax=Allacma fusca TaxID=39272 RepID=A0A8J2J4G6_9HEXA|nr:unnamed protein product [Allacma fusca]